VWPLEGRRGRQEKKDGEGSSGRSGALMRKVHARKRGRRARVQGWERGAVGAAMLGEGEES